MEEKELNKTIVEISETEKCKKFILKNIKIWKILIHLIFLIVSIVFGMKYFSQLSSCCYYSEGYAEYEFLIKEIIVYTMMVVHPFLELEIIYNILKWIKNRKIGKKNLMFLIGLLIIVISIYTIPMISFTRFEYEYKHNPEYINRHPAYKYYEEMHEPECTKIQKTNICNIYGDILEEKEERESFIDTYFTYPCDACTRFEQAVIEVDRSLEMRFAKKIITLSICVFIYNLIELFLSKKNKKFNLILLGVCLICIYFILYFKYHYVSLGAKIINQLVKFITLSF